MRPQRCRFASIPLVFSPVSTWGLHSACSILLLVTSMAAALVSTRLLRPVLFEWSSRLHPRIPQPPRLLWHQSCVLSLFQPVGSCAQSSHRSSSEQLWLSACWLCRGVLGAPRHLVGRLHHVAGMIGAAGHFGGFSGVWPLLLIRRGWSSMSAGSSPRCVAFNLVGSIGVDTRVYILL